jgi:tyrocidine synthetase-3
MDDDVRLNKKNIEDIYTLTPMQEGMLSLYLKDPQNDRYFEQLCLNLSGKIDVEIFGRAWNMVVEANESLRSLFRWWKVTKPVQAVVRRHQPEIRYHDLTSTPTDPADIEKRDRQESFDLRQVPFRITLCKLRSREYEMIISHHHILFDGWSSGIILSEFLQVYGALCRGELPPKPGKTAFKEFVKYLESRDVDAQRAFWREYLDGFHTNREASPARKKTGKPLGTGHRRFEWDRDRVDRLETFLQTHKVTAAAFLNTAWGLLLQTTNGSGDVVFDTTVSGRSAKLKGIEEMVGLFINTLPLRVCSRPGEPTLDLLKRVNVHLQEREQYEHTPLTVLHAYSGGAQQALCFDSLLVLENYPLDERLKRKEGPLAVTSYRFVEKTHHDVTVIVSLHSGIEVGISYDERLWPGDRIERLWHHFMKVVEQVLSQPERKAADIAGSMEIDRDHIFPVMAEESGQPAYRPPRSELEKKLAVMWAEVLDVEQSAIGIDADFFHFGGHSLKVNQLLAQLHRQLEVKVPWAQVFKTPTIRGLAAYIGAAGKDRCRAIVPVERRDYYVTSSAQKRLYMIQQMAPDDTAYNGPLAMLLAGDLDSDRLEDACLQLVRSHESLRTSFVEIDGEPVQRVHDVIDFKIEKGYAPHSCLDSRLTAFVSGFVRPFDLAQAPLLRVGLIKLKGQKHLLMVDMHHIVSDGISRDVLMKELAALYSGRPVLSSSLQYRDFCHWQQRQLLSGKLDGAAAFWQARFAEEPPVLNLPLDSPRPASQQYRGARLAFHLEPGLAAALHGLASESEATLFMVVLALLNILLSKYSGQEDMVVGTAIGGRYHADVQSVIGLLMETMALRNFPRADKGWGVFLQEVKETTLQAYANQEYPFRELLRQLAGESALGRNRLFDVMLIVQNQERVGLSLPGVSITPFAFDPGISKLDLTMEVFEGDEGIAFELEYSTALFKAGTISSLWQHFVHIIEQAAAADGETVLSGIQLATPMEKRQILEDFNGAVLDGGEKKPVPLQWSEQVEKTADRAAVVGDSGLHISYRQLDIDSGRLAHGLRQRGCRADTIVALKAERRLAMMVGLLGILKAGAAYLPIDPAYPEERVHYMLADSGARMLLTQRDLDRFAQLDRVLPAEQVDGSNLAYVIYTSGSTGRPKGVLVSHGSLAAYLYTFWQEFAISEADVVVQQASFSFDTFGEEVYPVLLRGGKVAIPEKGEVQDVALLANFIARHSITLLDCSPLLLNELNRHHHQRIGSLRIVISGGDALKKEYITHLLDFARVYNTYGPTEATICSTYHPCQSDDPPAVPIGRPITNYRIYILDRQQNLLPIGVPGELCISGVGVSLGYLNNPQLTADKFLNLAAKGREGTRSPQNTKSQILTPKSHILYRTGDLCRWLPDGRIEFLGRIDHQVKIRGFRIELEEIEKCLLNHEQVKEAVVLARDQKGRNTYLTAYIVPTPPTSKTSRTSKTSPAKLRRYLAESLPDYMVPAYFVFLEALPRTVSGKVDRKALPEPTEEALSPDREYMAPRTPSEERLTMIWQQTLGVDRIGIGDNFFELGGDSILANRTIARIREETGLDISLRAFFESPCIRSLAENMPVKESESHHLPTIPRTGKQENIPLSFSQERLWFLQQLDQESRAYHVPRALRIRGRLDITLFERTFTEIIRRHEILRTVFPISEGRPGQRVMPPFDFKIPLIDWSGRSEEEQRRSLEAFIVEEGRREFDFEQGPMLRVTALRLKETEHIVVSAEHHLVHDGWTQGVMLQEFIRIYRAFLAGKPSPLPELPIQYADYAVWQRQYMSGERLKRHLDFWQEKLSGLPPLLELPFDYPRPSVMSGRGLMDRLVLSRRLAAQLERFGSRSGVTLFMAMLTVFKVLLYRYSGVADLCVGTGIANRRFREMEGMLGMVINTLVLRAQVSPDMTFSECVQQVKTTCLQAYEYEETPFEKVVEMMRPARSLSYMPLVQVMFSFMDTPTENLQLPGLTFSVESSHNRSAKFDLNVVVIPPRQGEELRGEILIDWEYNTDIFNRETMQRMQAHYLRLLEEALHSPQHKIATLSLLSSSERHRLLHQFNRTGRPVPADGVIDGLFTQLARRHPGSTAVVGTDGVCCLSYGELNDQAHRLAGYLRHRGVGRGEAVGLQMNRSPEWIIAVLGVLKAGGIYLPIDPGLPQQRIQYILNDCGARVVLTGHETGIPGPDNHGSWTGDTEPSPSSPAYMIYTSGTTGEPKGVLVEHRSLVNLCLWHHRCFQVKAGDHAAQYAQIGFDASIWEIFPYLILGAKLHIIADGLKLDVPRLNAYFETHHITIAFLPTQMAEYFMEYENRSLRVLLTGGDRLKVFHPRGYLLYNNYGPTENTVVTTSALIEADAGNIPIGRPIDNNRVYILSRDYFQVQPLGAAGELCIGGRGLARGYLNNPELTADKFVSFKAAAKAREDTRSPQNTKSQILYPKSYILYRTGDLCRWLPDGNIEFLGRIDHQVKIRGFRIELTEIESQLMDHPAIREAVVIARADKNNDKAICAYIVPTPRTNRTNRTNKTSPAKLRRYLAESLPAYMIPAYFIPLDHIPVTSSGKVDRRALSDLEVKMEEEIVAAPKNEVEEKLLDIWADVLSIKTETIGVTADFFALGGHSLRAVVLTARIHQELDVRVPLEQVFLAPTIRGLAEYIRGRAAETFESVEMVEEKEYYQLSSAQKRLYIIQQMDLDSTAYNISQVVEPDMEIDRQRLEQVFQRLIQRHESFRTAFVTVDEAPVQRIVKEVDFEIEYDGQAEAFVRPFDLSRPPLLRVGLRPTPASGYNLMVDMHHIIGDGVSMQILAREFRALYEGERLAELKLRYRDYAHWQAGDRVRERIKSQERYWLELFAPEVPVLSLPTDFPRPLVQSFEGRRFGFNIGKKETDNINSLASAGGATLYMVLLALMTMLLAKLCGQEDIVVGTPTTGRRQAGLEHIVGMFVNTLAMRNCPYPDQTFGEFLQHVRSSTLKALENQEYQFEDLVDNVSVDRDTGRNPLFDVMLNVLNQWEYDGEMLKPGKTGAYEHRQGTSKFDLYWAVAEEQPELSVYVEYSARLFKPQTIERFIRYFKRMLTVLDSNPGIRLSDIELITAEERRQILSEFNAPPLDFPPEKTVHRVFVEQAKHTPDHTALIYQDRLLTYKELHRRSNQLAHLLRASGVFSDVIVGVMVERSLEMVTGILAILKAGGAYLPIDPAYPEKRKGYMIEGSGLSVLLTGGQTDQPDYTDDITIIEVMDERHFNGIDRNPAYAGGGSDLVYLIYTSGSTGRPKGVMLEHGNVMNLIYYQYRYTTIDFSRVLQFTTIGFDVSFQEIFSTLLCGGTLILIPTEMPRNIPQLCRLIARQQIKTLFLPASFLKFVFNEEEYAAVFPAGVRHIVTAGEQLIVTEKLRDYLKANRVHLHNHYGPSESHVVTALTMNPEGEIPHLPAIGKPLANTHIYMVDRDFHLQPVGVAGELLIGGVQVGRGYLNRPELTADKFLNFNAAAKAREDTRSPIHKILTPKSQILNPKSQPLYRTGDLARFQPDGNIEFLGRIDTQVKIRGFRIEPGEIESRLLAIDAVREAVVTVRGDGNEDKFLIAYVVAHRDLSVSTLREYLSGRLPEYMVPSHFVKLESLPLTPTGKIDRKALPAPEIGETEAYTAPRNRNEERIAALWSEILGVAEEKIGIDANFFKLGGHSLRAVKMLARLHKEFDVEIPLVAIFKAFTIRGLVKYIEAAIETKFSSIELAESWEYYPMSSAQQRLYILQQMEEGSTVYNMPLVIRVDEGVNREKLQKVFRALIERHESLRTSFVKVNEVPVQRVHREVDFGIEYYYLAAKDAKGREVIIKDFVRPFDLSRPPLLRVGLIRMHPSQEGKYILMVDMHHIISDGTSMQVLVHEFRSLYKSVELPALRIQYKDFSLWQNSKTVKEKIRSQEAYWIEEFSGEIPVLNLPLDYPRPAVQSFEGGSVSFELGKKKSERLDQLALDSGVTLFMVLTALFTIMLSRLSGQADIVMGTPTAGRRHADLEGVIGMFVNTLALRNCPDGGQSFSEFLQEVKLKTLKAFENQEYPFEDLVEKVDVRRDVSRNPLFDVMLVLQNIGDGSDVRGGEGLSVDSGASTTDGFENPISRFDMTWSAVQRGGQLYWGIEYCTRLFKPETIHRYANHFKTTADAVIANLEIKMGDIDILSADERNQILHTFNDTRRAYPHTSTVHEIFSHRAADIPDHLALCLADKSITYRALNEQTDLLALVLRDKGVGPETPVGLRLNRSIEMILTILGVLKAGGAYVPIDVSFPRERVLHILSDSRVRLLLTQPDQGYGLRYEGEIFYLEERVASRSEAVGFETESHPYDLIYIIYTSGSTGRPKGILIYHTGVVNILHHLEALYPVGPNGSYLLKTNYTFDVSVTELFGWFFGGGRLVILEPGGEKDPVEIIDTVERFAVTHINFVSSMLQVFLDAAATNGGERLRGLRYILVAGEAFSAALASKLSSLDIAAQVENIYGPTEATIYTTRYSLSAFENQSSVPIGRPMNNITTYIVGGDGILLPVNVWGELYIGGIGLARGYLNRPELTAEKFVNLAAKIREETRSSTHKILIPKSYILNPKSQILYRTGDLARFLPDGNIEFLGRIDSQVKIRGFRIEPGEIESRLLAIDAIREAVVIVRENKVGEKVLAAYVVSHEEMEGTVLKETLSKGLPDYMVPSYFMQLAKIPLTPNGKVDRKALPEPGIGVGEDYVGPRNEVEKRLAAIWSGVLGIAPETIGIHRNFFEIGGHSLKATILAARIYKELHVNIPLAEIFRSSTIEKQARLIFSRQKNRFVDLEKVEERDFYELSFSQQRLLILSQLDPRSPAYNMSGSIELRHPVKEQHVKDALARLVQRHDSLRTCFTTVNDQPVQVVRSRVEISLGTVDVSRMGSSRQQQRRDQVYREMAAAPFDLSQAPLFRVVLLKRTPHHYEILFVIHHIVSDGWSLEVLKKEFTGYYEGFRAGKVVELERLPFQYKDFAHHQNRQWNHGAGQRAHTFWRRRIEAGVLVMQLPTDFPGDRHDRQGGGYRCMIGPELKERLKELAGQSNNTLFAVLFSAFLMVLSRFSSQGEVVCTIIDAGREHVSLHHIIGIFVNPVIFMTRIEAAESFTESLRRLNEEMLEVFAHKGYPLETVCNDLNIRYPDVPVCLNMLNMQPLTEQTRLEPFAPHHIPQAHEVKFDIEPYITEYRNGIEMYWAYKKSLFAPETIGYLASEYIKLMDFFVKQPGKNLKDYRRFSSRRRIERVAGRIEPK